MEKSEHFKTSKENLLNLIMLDIKIENLVRKLSSLTRYLGTMTELQVGLEAY